MENRLQNILLDTKYSMARYIVYWFLSALVCFFIFSNRNYDISIRILLVTIQIGLGIGVTHIINYILIPKYLFKGKILRFSYILLFILVISIWMMMFVAFVILVYSSFYFPMMIVPSRADILVLISGGYLVILAAAIIHFIRESYRKLLEKNNLEKQKAETELKLNEAKMKLLQNQIHPHFLFNMLNNLYGLSLEKSDMAPDLILKLSQLLDYMLYECDKEYVLLSDDIKFIRNYLDLERIRHDENLILHEKINITNDKCSITPLLLFPFIENAFKHGLKDKTGKARIDITINTTQHQLNFQISNDISKSTSDQVLETGGIGLKNVKERLEILYHGKYKLEIDHTEREFKVFLELDLN